MAYSSVFSFLLPTHSVDCAVHLLLSHSRALLVSSALFHPFTALIMPFFLQFTALKCPFDGPFTALKCPFDGPFTALKCPFQMAPCPFKNLGRTLQCVFVPIFYHDIRLVFPDVVSVMTASVPVLLHLQFESFTAASIQFQYLLFRPLLPFSNQHY